MRIDGLPADGLLGMNLFRDGAVTFDFLHAMLFVGDPSSPER